MNWPLLLLLGALSASAYAGIRIVRWALPLPEDDE
jgi:hypothetical protein